jgi:dTDP-glucose pyrophosphorylase
MLTIVVPMAGRGSRFATAGYTLPKPLIPVLGTPMIALVIATIRPATPHRFVFVCQAADAARHDLRRQLRHWAPGCGIVELDGYSQGAACSVLAAEAEIGEGPLMIANSDQYVTVEIDRYLATLSDQGLDGLVMTMRASDPKWSFAAIGADGLVTRIAEKQPISPHATVGIYNFARGQDFIRGARAMIARDARVNGEFYVAPVYNDLIAAGARIGIFDLGDEGAAMHGLGTPADLEGFLASPLATAWQRGRAA